MKYQKSYLFLPLGRINVSVHIVPLPSSGDSIKVRALPYLRRERVHCSPSNANVNTAPLKRPYALNLHDQRPGKRRAVRPSSLPTSSIGEGGPALEAVCDSSQWNGADWSGWLETPACNTEEESLSLPGETVGHATPEATSVDSEACLRDADDTILLSSPTPPATNSQPLHDNQDCNGYHLVKVIGSGSYGAVCRVRHDNKPGRLFARKQLSLVKSELKTIKNEVDMIRRAKHPHVVRIVNDYNDKDWYYIVMSPLADKNLEAFLQDLRNSPHDFAEWSSFGEARSLLLSWLHCLAVAVRHIHGLEIRHRDIKPANILIHGQDICLADFGISFHSKGDTRRTHTSTRGTKGYEAKETQDGSRAGRSADIFSLGAVFFEMTEALCRPVLAAGFPRVTKPYFAHSDDQGFLQGILQVKEHATRRNHLPAGFRFNEGFLPPLLHLICTMLDSTPVRRPTADEVVRSLGLILERAGCNRHSCYLGE